MSGADTCSSPSAAGGPNAFGTDGDGVGPCPPSSTACIIAGAGSGGGSGGAPILGCGGRLAVACASGAGGCGVAGDESARPPIDGWMGAGTGDAIGGGANAAGTGAGAGAGDGDGSASCGDMDLAIEAAIGSCEGISGGATEGGAADLPERGVDGAGGAGGAIEAARGADGAGGAMERARGADGAIDAIDARGGIDGLAFGGIDGARAVTVDGARGPVVTCVSSLLVIDISVGASERALGASFMRGVVGAMLIGGAPPLPGAPLRGDRLVGGALARSRSRSLVGSASAWFMSGGSVCAVAASS